MSLFTDRPQIFRNKDHLENNYIPENFTARDTELKKYKDALYPTYKGEKGKNLFLYGDAGTGKTSMSEYVLGHLETDAKENENITINTVYVNCNTITSSYHLARELTNAFKEQRLGHTRNNVARKGYSKNDMFDFLFTELDKTNGTSIIILDEIDHIEEHDLLYELPRAHSNHQINPDTNAPCIIGISNDIGFLDTLAPNVADTLNETTIQFKPYLSETLINILETRAETAFYDDVLTDPVIPLCAAKAGQENGSARRALRLVRMAGEIARNNHQDTIREEHVQMAETKLDRELVQESITAGTLQTQLALLTLANKAALNETPERTSTIHEEYKNVCESRDNNALEHDRFRQRLDTLSERGIITRETKNDDGQYSEYKLNKDILVILEALADAFSWEMEDKMEHVFKRVVKNAEDNNHFTKSDLKDTPFSEMLQ